MTTYERWTRKKVLITARTYPVPSKKAIEVSCTAGITDDGKWIRLFPIPYRFLAQDKRFTKYQYIEANVIKSQSDIRPESYNINIDSIEIMSQQSLPTDNNWEARKTKIFPLKSDSLCSLQAERDRTQEPTLGFFKPKTISGFKIEPTSGEWSAEELACLRQYPLFGSVPQTELEKLPYNFSYEFKCDRPGCSTHTLSCIDWEMGASYRSWKYKYGVNWERKFRDRYETEMILGKDTHFFVGTIHKYPNAWIIIGLFYPPK
jgi:hypothetical protein